ncbi:UDP-N-acetylmuramate dehydrogenase [Hippea alviniae]|uniref:UDP-N-acetylmuramate dehydrogenase n=1 Tax=Hippea alviniae TaxID=1279027 RepID=UPI0004196CF2|nr:UDP-N-acetylmuramate dehydrogenase [Hippea alviniae]
MITKTVPLKRLTSIRQTGEVEVVFIESVEELEGVDFVIGNGSNLLVKNRKKLYKLSDNFSFIEKESGLIRVGAATSIRNLIKFCIDNGFGCVEFLGGVPASVGGAVYMNAGAFGEDMSKIVEYVLFVEDGKLKRTDAKGFSYRDSGIKGIIIEAALKCRDYKIESLKKKLKDFVNRRVKNAHIKNTFGSVFKNPSNDKTAGWLLEGVGLKGYTYGSVRFSEKHANYIVSNGNASADDVLFLIEKAKDRVLKTFGIELEEEVVII